MMEQVLNDYFNAWNQAFKSNDSGLIRSKMSEQFVGFWAHSSLEVPQQYDYHYDLDQVLKQYNQADVEKSFEIESITKRTNDVLVIGTETNKINGKPHPAKAIFIWRKENDDWKLLREYIELIN
ncbi:nuclear transport factor 2 family protein [Piscibacillus halophilus]|nr:nuclear transport factor 2 family protein [Piscibacillus halophilus]